MYNKVCVITVGRELFRSHVLNMPHVRFSNPNYLGRRRDCKFIGPEHLWQFDAYKDK